MFPPLQRCKSFPQICVVFSAWCDEKKSERKKRIEAFSTVLDKKSNWKTLLYIKTRKRERKLNPKMAPETKLNPKKFSPLN